MFEFIRRSHSASQRRRYLLINQRMKDIRLSSGMVSFTFDGCLATAARNGAKLLENYGWRGTFYLTTGLMAGPLASGRVCSHSEVDELHRNGHEIGGHTHSHVHCQGVNAAALRREHNLSIHELESFGGGKNLALPFGAYDYSSLNFFSGRYKTIRTINEGINRGLTDLNLLKANPIYESTDLEKYHNLINQVCSSGGWLIFYTHDICASPSKFGCTPALFDAVLRMVKEAGLLVDTISSVYNIL